MKTHLILILALILLTRLLTAQENKASVSLAAAIYEEEVTGNLDKAVELYLNILKKYPDDRPVAAKTLYHLGLVHEKMGKQKADEYFRRLVNTYPDQTGMVALAKARLTQIESSTNEATVKAEQSFKMAADLFKQAKYVSAVAEYEKVITLAPKSQLAQEAQLWIGQCFLKQGKNDLALKSLNTLIKDCPESAIIPVTEMMIGQVKQAMEKEPEKSSIIAIDEKSLLDTISGVKYTKVNSWAGKYDIIKSASSISDIFPNRKFLLTGNTVIPFDHSGSFTLFDTLSYGKLSPDGTQIAFFTKNGVSVLPVSPETGKSAGPALKVINKEFRNGYDINWASDGNKLIVSLYGMNNKSGIWSFSTIDDSLKLLKESIYLLSDPCFAMNDSAFFYRILSEGENCMVEMKSIVSGKSVSILDSCAQGRKKYLLSPDNRWILYEKTGDKTFLYLMADLSQKELIIPEEVGDFVSWADEGTKVFSYCPSSYVKDVMKIASIYGGPAFEIEAQKTASNVGWSPDSREIIVTEKTKSGTLSLKMVNLINQHSKTIEGIQTFWAYPFFSPDYSKLLIEFNTPRHRNLMVLPVSIKDRRVTGKSILILEGFHGFSGDYSWSKDGKKIAICNDGEVWICTVSGGPPVQLTQTPVVEKNPSWSYDGKAIAVFVHSTHQLRIIKSSDGEVLMTIEKVDSWVWSPGGKEIFAALMDGELNAFSIETGKSRKIVNWKEITKSNALSEMAFSPDGLWVSMVAYKNGVKNTQQLYLLNIADEKATEMVGNEGEIIKNIRWSPDSKWISYSSKGEIKKHLESVLWETDLTGFMNKLESGSENGKSAYFDFKTPAVPAGGVLPDGTFTDARDGRVYKYKKIGEQTWMAENLAFLPEVSPDSSTSFVDKHYYVYGYNGTEVQAAKNIENYRKFGVLYNWTAAMNGASGSNSVPSGVQGACPSGWHLPSDAEWMVLEKTLGMSDAELKIEATRYSGNVGDKLKSTVGWDDDNLLIGQSGFNALPGGVIIQSASRGLNQTAYFWTSTALNDYNSWNRIISLYGPRGIFRNPRVVSILGHSIRCVKD